MKLAQAHRYALHPVRSDRRRAKKEPFGLKFRKWGVVLPAFRYLGVDLAQVDVEGLRITQTRYAPHQTQPWHCHENPNFHFLLGGQFIDESPDLGPRFPDRFSLVFHPAATVHRTVAGPEGRHGLNIEPGDEWLSRYDLSGRDLGAYRIRRDARPSLALVAFALGSFSKVALSDAIFESLFVPSGEERQTPAWFKRLESLLDEDASARWSLRTLAAEVGVHPVYLARVFRRRYGIPLTAYLQQSRLLDAARKLETAPCLTTVALEAGFADHAHLSRSFKAWFGISPSQARGRLKEVSIVQA